MDEALKIVDRWKLISEMETAFEYRKWSSEVPFLEFKKGWLVSVIPPFAGATARFIVKHKNIKNSMVSVYLDCYDQLGCYGEPYWEVYPVDGDTARVPMKDAKSLIKNIDKALKQQKLKQQRPKKVKK